MSVDDIQPAMAPIHPEKPWWEILPGFAFVKAASQKAVNRPRCQVLSYRQESNKKRLGWIRARRLDRTEHFECSERVFRRDWEPA